jgi:hypothetical protein
MVKSSRKMQAGFAGFTLLPPGQRRSGESGNAPSRRLLPWIDWWRGFVRAMCVR